MTLAHQQMSNDYEKLKQEEAEKSARLQELMYVKKSHKIANSKLTNEIINAKLASPKKSKKSLSLPSRRWDDNEKSIEHICDYYDELQYNCEHTKPSYDNNSNNNNNQIYQLTKMRKDILNRKLLDYRKKLKCDKISKSSLMNEEKSLVSSISSLVETMTIPTFHFHLILSLTMMLLTHQCPQYLLVL